MANKFDYGDVGELARLVAIRQSAQLVIAIRPIFFTAILAFISTNQSSKQGNSQSVNTSISYLPNQFIDQLIMQEIDPSIVESTNQLKATFPTFSRHRSLVKYERNDS